MIELLVVIAIIAILASMLLPALVSAREAARFVLTKNNLKQTVVVMQEYGNDFGRYQYVANDSTVTPVFWLGNYEGQYGWALESYLPADAAFLWPANIPPELLRFSGRGRGLYPHAYQMFHMVWMSRSRMGGDAADYLNGCVTRPSERWLVTDAAMAGWGSAGTWDPFLPGNAVLRLLALQRKPGLWNTWWHSWIGASAYQHSRGAAAMADTHLEEIRIDHYVGQSYNEWGPWTMTSAVVRWTPPAP